MRSEAVVASDQHERSDRMNRLKLNGCRQNAALMILLTMFFAGCGSETAETEKTASGTAYDSGGSQNYMAPAPASAPADAAFSFDNSDPAMMPPAPDSVTDRFAEESSERNAPGSGAATPRSVAQEGTRSQSGEEATVPSFKQGSFEPGENLAEAKDRSLASPAPAAGGLPGQPEAETMMGMGGMGGMAGGAIPGVQQNGARGDSGMHDSKATRVPVNIMRQQPSDGAAALVQREANRRLGERRIHTLDLLPGEELWVIARPEGTLNRRSENPEIPGCGSLMAQVPGQSTPVPVPLKHTAVTASVEAYIASVDVTQQFHNPFASKIEAVYVFPLPENAAVNEFVMTIGERRIRGIIREREKAEQIYAQARAQGHVAALMTEERPNIFTQKVANIEPGKQIDINIRYFNTLRYDDGSYEFVFPMVVGPRFNPPFSAGNNGQPDGIGSVARNQPGSSGQPTEVSYLKPNERSGHDISLTLNINAGIDVRDVRSVNHQVAVTEVSECQRKIVLSAADTLPNRDFVLRYRVAGEKIGSTMLTQADQHGQYFTMMVLPPADLRNVERSPMEMVFVLDCSGSMNGRPIEQAKAAIAHAVQQLTARDTFQIIQFNSTSSKLGTAPIPATPENLEKALRYLQSLDGSGGTVMLEGIRAALDFPHDEGRFRLVSFMTDGFIGNEQEILKTLGDKLGASRVFSFGVGQSPNRYLMDRMAIVGRGAVSYLSLNDDAVSIMEQFQKQISHPAMTDLYIDFGDMQVTDVYPQRLPDLIVGRPVIITGRYQGTPSAVTVGGRVGNNPQSFVVSVSNAAEAALTESGTSGSSSDEVASDQGDNIPQKHPGIAAVWARMKIADLMMAATQSPEQLEVVKQEALQTALNYNLMSAYTAFVAVDSLSRTAGEFGTTVAVPVPVPEGVRYDTSVSR